MKILSWNVIGIGVPKRHRNFKTVRNYLKPKISSLQETKILEERFKVVKNILWQDVGYVVVHSKEKLGGLICLWDKIILDGNVIVSEQHFCSLLFTFLDNKERFMISNVYAPTIVIGRRTLWNSLHQMRDAFRGLFWIVIGDFNVSLYPFEKRGGS